MKVSILTVLTAALFFSASSHAATSTAKAQMKVLSAIEITKNSDLLFADATPGTVEEQVAADTQETNQNASFSITGEPDKAIVISLPIDGTVVMKKNGGGTADTEIPVNSFTSNSIPTLDASGSALLYVGATRATLSQTQERGDYEADFQVDVIY